jgi:hypothetical protein
MKLPESFALAIILALIAILLTGCNATEKSADCKSKSERAIDVARAEETGTK